MFKRKISETLLLKANLAIITAQEVSIGPLQQTRCYTSPRMWDQVIRGKHEEKNQNISVLIHITPPAQEIQIKWILDCVFISLYLF